MTNLIFTLMFSAVTNWTGVTSGTNELGYVVTNHQAQVIYEGATNLFLLKSVPTSIAVWRPAPTLPTNSIMFLTNYWMPGLVITNQNATNFWLKGVTPL